MTTKRLPKPKPLGRASLTFEMPQAYIATLDALADIINHDAEHKWRPEGGKKATRGYLVRRALSDWFATVAKEGVE